MPDADHLLAALRGDDTHLHSLVRLGVDDLLGRRVDELVQPDWLAERVVEGLRASADDDRTREWIRQHVHEARDRIEQHDGAPLKEVNPDLIEPLKELLARPYSPDAQVLLALLDHAAMRELVRDVLLHTLQAYARQLKVPDGAKQAIKSSGLGRSRLAAWAGAAKVAANMVGSEVEKRVEGRVYDFVDGAIGNAIEVGVHHICDPKHAAGFGRMRADAVDTLVGLDSATWVKELDKLELEELIDDVHAMVKALARSEDTSRQMARLLTAVVEEAGDKTAKDFLSGSGLEEGWRPQLEELALERARAFVATDAFEGWLTELCASSTS